MRKICAFFSVIGMIAVMSGCAESKPTPGQQLDKAIDKSGDAIKKAGDEVKKAGDAVKEEVKK